GSDYTLPASSVTFAPGSATADLTVTVLDDSDPEFDETCVVTIESFGPQYTVGTPDSATVIIRDNDPPLVSVEKVSDTVEGSASPGEFVLTRQGDKSGSLTVNFTVGGTATAGTDYTSIGTSVTFAAGEVNA